MNKIQLFFNKSSMRIAWLMLQLSQTERKEFDWMKRKETNIDVITSKTQKLPPILYCTMMRHSRENMAIYVQLTFPFSTFNKHYCISSWIDNWFRNTNAWNIKFEHVVISRIRSIHIIIWRFYWWYYQTNAITMKQQTDETY